MPLLSPCLSPAELEQFLLGRMDEDRSLSIEGHLQDCAECQQRMMSLGAEDELVQALRGQPPVGTEAVSESVLNDAPPELVNLLVPHFKRIANALEETIEMAGGPTHSTADAASQTGHPSIDVSLTEEPTYPRQLGRYEIRGVLGRGGMGTVLHAFDPLLNRSIAVKVLQTEWLAEAGMAERMVREAQAAAAVQHDNIVAIYSVELRNGNPCIVMPLLHGVSLHQRLQEVEGPLPVAEFLRIAREACLGLAAAHTAGLIHCDIKPANLWLEAPNDRVKILDFGLAVVHGDGNGADGSISGTPGYLAPEQAKGLPLDQRTDIFSLGCVLYRMATGKSPFTGERRLKALWTVLAEPPVAASEINPALPDELSDLISGMMARSADDRPATVTKVLAVLDEYERRQAELRGGVVRRRWLLGMLGAALISGAGVGAWAMFNAPRTAKPVVVTFLGDEPALDVIVHREDREWPLTLGPEVTLSLPPGDYSVRPATVTELRQLVPEQFVVTDQKSQVVRIAFVGELARHAQHTQMVTGVAMVPGQNPPVVLSVGQDRALVRWDTAQPTSPTFQNLSYSARCVAISPSGDEVATAGGNKSLPPETDIELRPPNQIDGPVRRLVGHQRRVTALAYSPDGQWLASVGGDGVFLWNRATGQSQLMPESESHTLTTLAISADSQRLLSGGDDGQTTLWDLSSQSVLQTRVAGTGTVRAVGFLKAGFVTAGDDGVVRIWSDNAIKPREFTNLDCPIFTVAISTDCSQLLTGDRDGTIRLWSLTTGEQQKVGHGHSHAVQTVMFVKNGRQAVSGSADGTVRLWQLPFP